MYLPSFSSLAWVCSWGSGSISRKWVEESKASWNLSLALVLCYFCHILLSKEKSQGQPKFKGWGNRLHPLMGGAANSNCKGWGNREGWNWDMFALNLLQLRSDIKLLSPSGYWLYFVRMGSSQRHGRDLSFRKIPLVVVYKVWREERLKASLMQHYKMMWV